MKELGYREGPDYVIESHRHPTLERLVEAIPAMVASRPDVVLAAGGPVLRPLIDAKVPQPIVFTFSADVVVAKVVESWSRPGVNRSGLSYFSIELLPKRLSILREMLPGAKRVAIIGSPRHSGEPIEVAAAEAAAASVGLQHRYFGAHTAPELEAALEGLEKWGAEALLVLAGPVASAYPDRIAAFALRKRIPAISAWAPFAEAGNLMTYGPSLDHSYARLASFVDRVLKGERLAEAPIEGPSKIELVINRKAAAALGVAVPTGLLLRADRVIE